MNPDTPILILLNPFLEGHRGCAIDFDAQTSVKVPPSSSIRPMDDDKHRSYTSNQHKYQSQP